MNPEIAFDINLKTHSIHQLTLEDLPAIQALFEQCLDFMLLVDGHPADPAGVRDDFLYITPGNVPEDKFVFGIVNQQNNLEGYLDVMRGYPDKSTWWIGLLMFAPEARSHGIGRKVLEGFIEYVRAHGGQAIMLGVVEANLDAYRFWNRIGFEFMYKKEPQQFGEKTHAVIVMRRMLQDKK